MTKSGQRAPAPASTRWVVTAFAILFLVVLTGGTLLYVRQLDNRRHVAEDELNSITTTKAQQIANWRNEQLADSLQLAQSPLFAAAVRRWLVDRSETDRVGLERTMALAQKHYDLDTVALLDQSGTCLLPVTTPMAQFREEDREDLQDCWRDQRAINSQLHMLNGESGPYIETYAPVMDALTDPPRALAVLVLRSDARARLYPMVSAWPTTSSTAESLLIRPEGDQVVFLSELRFQPNAPLSFRLPMTRADLPAVMAAKGVQGVVEGRDYRNEPVLACIRPIPDSPWLIVTKVDKRELYASWRRDMRMALVVTLALCACVAAIGNGVWQRQRKAHFRSQLQAQSIAAESDRRLREALDLMIEGGQIIDHDWRFVYVNDAAARYARKPRQELIGHTMMECFPQFEKTDAYRLFRECMDQGTPRTVESHFTYPDGAEAWFLLNIQPVPEGLFILSLDITDHKLAETRLQASENRFRAAIVHAPLPIMIYAEDGEIISVNGAWREITGYDFDNEVTTLAAWLKLAHGTVKGEEILTRINARFDAIDPSARLEYEVRCHDGSTRVWEINSVALGRQADGRRLMCSMGSDITVRKQAEQALHESEQHLRNLADSGQVLIITSDSKGKCDYVNQTWLDYTGMPIQELMGDGWSQSLHPDDREMVTQGYEKAFQERVGFSATFRLRRHDDCYRWFHGDTMPRYDSQGQFLGYIAHCLDVTDTHRANARIEHLNRVLNAVRSINLLIVSENDPDRLISTACELLVSHRGYMGVLILRVDDGGNEVGRAAAGRTCVTPPVSPDGPPPLPLCCQRVRKSDSILRIAEHPCGPNCPLGVENGIGETLSAKLTHGGRLYGYITVVLDVQTIAEEDELGLFEEVAGDLSFALDHMHKQAEVERGRSHRQQLEADLFQAQKMEAVGRLAGGVAHDFNNLLTVILGQVQLLQIRLKDSPHFHRLEGISEAANRAASLTQQLLAFSRKQILLPERFGVAERLRQTTKLLGRTLGEDIDLRLELAPEPVAVVLDPAQFDQIIMNLAINSRDAMPTGGVLTIATALEPMPQPESDDTSPWLKLSVTDTGVGMDKATVDHIFEPFFTTKPVGKGTGLGLATVHGIVAQFGGHIDVESEPGKGTSFTIWLEPAADGDDHSGPKRRTIKLPRGTGSVLVVEDDNGVRELARESVLAGGYRVEAVPTGEDALALLGDDEQKFDLLITDVVMPGMSGTNLAQQAQARQPNLQVLFMSGYQTDMAALEDIVRTHAAFIQKPFRPGELLAAVKQSIGG